MGKKVDFDLEKVFKAVMNIYYDEENYNYYNKKLSEEDKVKVVEYLLSSLNCRYDTNQIDFKDKADNILKCYYECPIKGNEFIKPITMDFNLPEIERLWTNACDINQVRLLYNKNNIRTVVFIEKRDNTFESISLLDFIDDSNVKGFIENQKLTTKQKYQVYTDVYEMLLKELD